MTTALSITQKLQGQSGLKSQYYRPELDLLRLAAFLFVFSTHGPRLQDPPGAPLWRHLFAATQRHIANTGAYGLCLFFFLSSYLITEILLREREKTGSVHLKSFYVRRILRIWPLYYLGVALAIAIGYGTPQALSGAQIAEMIFLVGWIGTALNFNPFGVLWSISVEELFYAVWPTLARGGVRSLQRWCGVVIVIAILASLVWNSWYNPVMHFVFFATGAIVAMVVHKQSWQIGLTARSVMAFTGFAIWLFVSSRYFVVRPSLSFVVAYILIDAGCILLFLAIFALPKHLVPHPLVYLGQISYGLYVFHLYFIRLATERIVPHLPGHNHDLVRLLEIYAMALLLTIVTAALSYQYFEKPFLRLKKHFEIIHTRPLEA